MATETRSLPTGAARRTGILAASLPYLIVGVLAALLAFPPLNINTQYSEDYSWHGQQAQTFATTGQFSAFIPHPLYHLTLAGLIIALPFLELRWLVLLFAMIAFAIQSMLMYHLLRTLVGNETRRMAGILIAVTLAVTFLSPLNFIELFNQPTVDSLYIGYIHPNLYHNPTTIFLRPFTVALFLVIASHLLTSRQDVTPLWQVGALALLSLLTLLAKPNLMLVLMPALGLWVVWRAVQREYIDWRLVLGFFALPTLALLYQYLLLTGERTAIAIAPFASLAARDMTPIGALWRLPLSIAFPLVVYGLFFTHARRSVTLNFTWLGFVIGLAQFYLLLEVENPGHLNWSWGGQMALLLLFAVSAGFLLTQSREGQRWRVMSAWGVLALHVLAGGVWWIWNIRPFW